MLDDYLALFLKDIAYKPFQWPLDVLPPEILRKIVPDNRVLVVRGASKNLHDSVKNAKLPAVVKTREGVTFPNGRGLYQALTTTSAFCMMETLSLRNCDLKLRGAASLADVLRLHTNVVSLDLSHNQLGDGGVRALQEVFWLSSMLKTLNLHCNKVGPQGWKDIAAVLRVSTTLSTLCLMDNPKGKDGGLALADAMNHNNTLTSLNLSCNQFRDEAGERLASALRSNTALRDLDLYCNWVRDRTGSSMARMLLTNTTLTSLNLRLSSIKDSAIEIALALRENTTLRRLDIAGSDMESAGERAFEHLERYNSTCYVTYFTETVFIEVE